MPVTSPSKGNPGSWRTSDSYDQNSSVRAAIRAFLSSVGTVSLVQVMAVYPDKYEVDIQIIVHQVTGGGVPIPHGIIYGVPYHQVYGNGSGVKIAPGVGDIGAALVCSRDITKVKASKQMSPPDTFRTFDHSDSLYLGGFLNPSPLQYVEVTGGSINLVAGGCTTSGNLSVATGATGSFSTPTGQVVTVRNGIITNIA